MERQRHTLLHSAHVNLVNPDVCAAVCSNCKTVTFWRYNSYYEDSRDVKVLGCRKCGKKSLVPIEYSR